MRAGTLPFIALTMVLAGCESASPIDPLEFRQVTITPTAQVYAPGGVVALRFNNSGTRSIVMGICFSSLFRQAPGGGWIQDRALMGVCPDVLQKVDGYSSVVLETGLPEDLAPGHYRLLKEFTVLVDGFHAGRSELSTPFQVQ